MKKTIRPILRDDLSRKGLEKRIDLRVYCLLYTSDAADD